MKAEPPSRVRVENADGFYNITWDHGNQVDCLTFTVRVRNSNRLSEVTRTGEPSGTHVRAGR